MLEEPDSRSLVLVGCLLLLSLSLLVACSASPPASPQEPSSSTPGDDEPTVTVIPDTFTPAIPVLGHRV